MSNKSFKKMLKRRGPSMEPCGTLIIVFIHETKTESSLFFRIDLKGNLLVLLDYYYLNHKHAV